jgi:hypothetical protein
MAGKQVVCKLQLLQFKNILTTEKESKFLIDSNTQISNLDIEKYSSCHNFEKMHSSGSKLVTLAYSYVDSKMPPPPPHSTTKKKKTQK